MKKSFKKSILFMWLALLGFIMPMQVSAYYIAGWGTNWNPDAYNMGSEGTYTFSMQTAGEYKFKVTAGNWDSQWGCGSLNASDVKGVATKGQCNNSGDDVVINLSKNADVTITFNGSKITVNAVENTTAVTCFLKGSFDSWGNGEEMTLNGNQYELKDVELDANTELKINYVDTWTGYDEVKSSDKSSFCTRGTGDGDNNIVISAKGTYSFYYKFADNELYIVQESSSDSEEDNYLDVIECDPKNTKVIFKEEFNAPSSVTSLDDKSRWSYSVSEEGYSAKVPDNYAAMVSSCTAIKNEGQYAVLVNPFYAGCGTQENNDPNACNCNDSQWYKNITDHTGNTYGGMLFYNCKDGTKNEDILYQCEVDVCANTFINFSAYIAAATSEDRGCSVKAKVRFILYDVLDNKELSKYTTEEISLKTEDGQSPWKEIAVMFNSADAKKVKLELRNLAAEGCGNDILLDDITFSVCNPQADLVFSGTTSSTATIIQGQTKKLEASITSGLMTESWYIWQSSTDNLNWNNIGTEPIQVDVNDPATLEVSPVVDTYYRAIVASSEEDADAILEGHDPSACGMYAITNTVTANVVNLGLISNLSDGAICADGVDKNTLTLKVTNPLNVAVTGVKVAVEIPEGVTAYNAGTTTEFTGFAEFDLAANGTKTLKLDLKSTAAITASVVKSIKSYIAKIFDLTWDAESALVTASSNITVNPVPTAKFAVASENICKGSTTTGTNVIISNGSPNYTLTIGGTNYTATTSPYLFAVNPTSTTTYTLTKVMDAKGCYSTPTSNNTVTVNVEEIKITTHPASTSVCVGAGATFSVVASGVDKYQWQVSSDNSNWNNISGATASTYTISATTANDNNKYYRVVVSKDGGKCEQQESNSAILTVKTTTLPSLTRAEYKECATSGNVQLSTLFSGTDLKFYSDAALTNQVTTFSASEVVTGKKYYATQTVNGCTSAAAEIPVTILELPKLTLATTNKTAICGTESDSKATLTYQFNGGKAPYTLSVQRTEDGGATETITPSNLSATGTYVLQPTTKTTYKFTQVKDVNGCVSASASGLVDDVVIDVKRLDITSNLNDESVCADKKITYSIGADGDDIKYQWYESTNNGSSFNKVGTNSSTYTTGNFAIGDKKQYKVVVSQNPEVCSSITSAVSAVTVNDCSSFELAYTSVKNVVCKEDQIELKLTLSNNSDIDAANVTVNISNIANQYFVSSSSTTYNHVAGTWTIASLRKGDSVTLTIILKGTTVVKDVVSVAYISKSGSTTYTETTTQAKDTENITVKGITAKPSVTNYAACPVEGMLNLVDQVTSDKTNLVFYTTETGFESKTQSSKNAEGITPYWVTNTKAGECESDRTKLDIQVYPQPTATISGTAAICKGESTNLTIALTGTEKYNIVLSSGDGKSQVTGSSTTIAVSPTETTPYTLTKVEDGNGCPATLFGSAKVTVNNKPSITINENPRPSYCAGMQYTLPNVSVNYNGSDKKPEVEGWYLDGEKLPSNKVTFKLGDVSKKLVYKAENGCGGVQEEFISSLDVEDCADIILNYSLDKRDYCPGDEAVLTATIKNNGETALSDVKLYQTWSGKQTTISSSKDKGTYENNVWTLTSLAKGESATLTIKFTANESEIFKMHVTAANGVTYSSYDASVANGFAELVVKEISENVRVNNYISCPNNNTEFPITDLVTSNKDGLKVMGKNDAGEYYDLTTVPTVNPSVQTTSTTYYITNIENGKCESTTPTPITIEIYKPVKASISGLSPLCSGETSNVDITLEGTPEFTVVYNNGTADITQKTSETTLNIAESLSSTTTYKLVSVTDKNSCSAYLDGTELVTITVNPRPELVSFEIEDSDDIICEGESTNLKATFTGTAPFTFKINGEEKTSDNYNWSMEISESGTYTITDLSDAKCTAADLAENEVTLTVEDLPEVTLSATDVTLNCTTPTATITASGATTYEWSYTDVSGNIITTSGNELNVKQTDENKPEMSTEYTVYGYSEHNCKSENPVTVTVKEDFVKPFAEIKIQDKVVEGETVEVKELNCTNGSIVLEAIITSTEETITEYSWSTGDDGKTTSEITDAGDYTLTVKGENGCTYTAYFNVKQNITEPTIKKESFVIDPETGNQVSTDILTCKNTKITLSVESENPNDTEGVEFSWYNKIPEAGEEIDPLGKGNTYSVTTSDTYVVVAKGGNGCTDNVVFEIEQDIKEPTFEINPSSYEITCEESKKTVELKAEPAISSTFVWKDENGAVIGTDATYVATEGGTYTVIATAEKNGCPHQKDITIEEHTDLPTVEITASGEKVTCTPNILTASGAISYEWKNESGEIVSKEATYSAADGGKYSVYGTNKYGCVGEAEITLDENKLEPVIKLTSDTTHITCRRDKVVLTSEVTNSEDTRTYNYEWSKDNSSLSGSGNTYDAKQAGTYKVTITDETNACKAEKTITVNENIQNPLIDVKPLPAVCLPATVELKDAIGSATIADEIKFFEDEAMTKEITDTNIDVEVYTVYYAQGIEVDNNGCVNETPMAIPVNLKSSTPAPTVNDYDDCVQKGTKTLSSLVTSAYNKLTFYAEETSEEPIADLFDASAENTTKSYWVTNTGINACESERAEIEVHIEGLVDFTVEASDKRLPAGENIEITVSSTSDTPVEHYIWYRNGEFFQVEDEEYLSEIIYLDTKYEVKADGRCNSLTQEVNVEAIWPTAFTPHNLNGKNDTFAKGMQIIVFNRFYTKIYEGPDGWDGSINGTMNSSKQIAVPGVYFYSVKLPNGQVKKGTIEIVKM